MNKGNLLRRFFALALCATLVGGTAAAMPIVQPDSVITASAVEESDFTWNFNNGILRVSGTGDMPVYNWSSSSFTKNEVTSLVVDEGVTSVSASFLSYSTSLQSVKLPSTVTKIHSSAFSNCTALISVTLPEGLENIASYTFSTCSSLASIKLPNSLKEMGYAVFTNCTSLSNVNYPVSLETCGTNVFSNTAITEITIPQGVTKVANYLFYGCGKLNNINFPSTLTEIGDYSFHSCKALENLSFPNGLKKIGSSAFNSCTGLTAIRLPDGLQSLGSNTFSNCTNLSSINYPSSLQTAGTCTYYNTAITEITVPEGVTFLPENAFYETNKLETVNLPSTLKEIRTSAFNGCTSMQTITLPEGLETIGHNGFSNCTSLTNIVIPESVNSIGQSAFSSCKALTDIQLPSSLTLISNSMFNSCTSLSNITIPESVETLGSNAFAGCTALESIHLPDSIKKMNGYVFSGCSNLSQVNYPISLEGDSSSNNFKGTNITEITIPEGVTFIPRLFFAYSDSLVKVNLPSTMKTIGQQSFWQCPSLKTINLPSGLEEIQSSAFYACTSLERVNFPSSLKKIGTSAYNGCTSLSQINYPVGLETAGTTIFANTNITSITVPSGVTALPDNVFYDVSTLQTVSLPSTLKTIGKLAFKNCSSIENITLPNALETIDSEAFYDCTLLGSIKVPKSVTVLGLRALGYYYDSGERNTKVSDGFSITGYMQSASETYASNNGITFNTVPLTNSSTLSHTKIILGNSVKMYANIDGGLDPYTYTYSYKKLSSNTWTVIGTANTTNTNATFKPDAATTYDLKLSVKDATGEIKDKILSLEVTPELSNESSVSATEAVIGDKITLTAVAAGGSGNYRYSFYFRKSGETDWTLKGKEYGTDTTAILNPGTATTYEVMIKVRDSRSIVKTKNFNITVTEPLKNESSVSTVNALIGQNIKLKGAASGGTAPYKYAFYFRKNGETQWKLKGTEFGSETTATLTPGSATTYEVMIKVKDAKDSIKTRTFTIKVSEPLINKSKVSTASVNIGKSVTLTGAASGGTAPYKYAFYFRKSGETQWKVKGTEFGTGTTATLSPGTATTYEVMIKVKDAKNEVKTKTFTIKVSEPLTNKSRVSAASVNIGKSVTLTGAASGGTAPYKYAFYFRKSGETQWKLKGTEFGSETTATLTPGTATIYEVMIKVKDATDKTVEKTFSIIVK